jgi:hypothetical protein
MSTGSAEDRALRSVTSDFYEGMAVRHERKGMGDRDRCRAAQRTAPLGQLSRNEEEIAAAIMGAHEASWPSI